MPFLNKYMILLILLAISAFSQADEEIPVILSAEHRFRLESYSMTALEDPVVNVHCTDEDTWNPNSFVGNERSIIRDLGVRDLKPTDNPYTGGAAWVAVVPQCQAKDGYYNGVRIKEFSDTTGMAMIELGRFVNLNGTKSERSTWDAHKTLQYYFTPDMGIEDKIEYEAQCKVVNASYSEWASFDFNARMICTLEKKQGQVTFIVY